METLEQQSQETTIVGTGLLTVESLIQSADAGVRLAVDERRRCLSYLMHTDAGLTVAQLSNRFHVSETQIRKDKHVLREELAKEVYEDDISLVVADIALSFRRQISDLENSKKKAKQGTKEYLMHCKVIAELELKKIAVFQEMGYIPKNVGSSQANNFEWATVVLKGDQMDTRPVGMFDEETEKRISEAKKRREVPVELVPQQVTESVSEERKVVYVKPEPVIDQEEED